MLSMTVSQVVQELLRHGASSEKRDLSGRTALSSAAIGGREDVVEVLLDHGVKLEVTLPQISTLQFP